MYKVSRNHIYGTNVGWKTKPKSSNYDSNISNAELVDQSSNTVITTQDFANKKGNYDKDFFAELRTPRDFKN